MKPMHGWAVAAMAAAMLGAAPTAAQSGSCDGGRGGLMTDLGFENLRRSAQPVRGGQPGEVRFHTEPRITGVRANGPAAGKLRDGDVLVALDGRAISTDEGARRYRQIRPGERVLFSVRRDGRVAEVAITAMGRCIPHPPVPAAPEAPQTPAAPVPPTPPAPPQDEIMPEGWMGFTLECQNCGEDESTGTFRFFDVPVLVRVEPSSPAARAGLRSGDRLTHMDGISLTSPAGWPRFNAIQPGQHVRFAYSRDGQTREASLSATQRPLNR